MHHMKKVSVSDLRYHFAEVERLLQRGEKIEITKRKQVIAHLVPVRRAVVERPDFWRGCVESTVTKTLEVSNAQLLAQERNRY